ncbi:Uncharacterized protein dnl_63240 [Desulfonema limicola]|uniref:HNH endonuclease n=1 Tax=Desulfonema limicola TaxID=45656 RepID=A0A975BEP3_9BACT|nr:hypothetical protein [Desulfonema limicola]QTA83900.1 Uncharacterized protein dnl_63240 [Desulfonema limicola]
MPCDYSQYPENWKTEIRPAILKRAGHCCEGSKAYPDCRVKNYSIHPLTGSRVILTIAHVNHDIKDNRYENLRAWCQLCHNTHDAENRARNRYRKRWEDKNQLKLWSKGK